MVETSQPDMRQHVDEMMAGIDAAMEPLDKRLYAAAEKEFKERALTWTGNATNWTAARSSPRNHSTASAATNATATWHGRTRPNPPDS